MSLRARGPVTTTCCCGCCCGWWGGAGVCGLGALRVPRCHHLLLLLWRRGGCSMSLRARGTAGARDHLLLLRLLLLLVWWG